MGNFKFKTQVISTLTLEYHIEADSLEEALEEAASEESGPVYDPPAFTWQGFHPPPC